MIRRLFSTVVFLSAAACLGGTEESVCDRAEALADECGGSVAELEFGECDGEAEEAAHAVLDAGCEGLDESKGDLSSQLCIGPLKKFFPWCLAEDYRCEPRGDDLDPSLCNGSAELCERRYDEVVFATSHNAFSAATMGYLRPNQSKRMYVQLRDGIRALMLDTHSDDGELSLCHINCSLGSVPAVSGLAEVRDFLDCYPNEVVTLIIEPHAPGAANVDAIRSAGLESQLFTKIDGEAWPTLGEMIAADTRLVVLAEKPGDETPPWYHHQWDHGFDNEFSVDDPADFACDVKRGAPNADLFGLNHFVTVLGGDEFLAQEPNTAESLHAHVEQCRGAFDRLPNFLAVDFHDIGDVVEVAEELNRH